VKLKYVKPAIKTQKIPRSWRVSNMVTCKRCL